MYKNSLTVSLFLALLFFTVNVCSAAELQDDTQFDNYYLYLSDVAINQKDKQNQQNSSPDSPDIKNSDQSYTLDSENNESTLDKNNNESTLNNDKFYNNLSNYISDVSGLGSKYGQYLAKLIIDDSNEFNVDPVLVASMYQQESGYRMDAISSAGAIGIAQLMPSTAASMGYDPTDLESNVKGGVQYLSYQLKRFTNAGDMQATYAVAAYNAGAGAVQAYGDVPPYQETRNYVTCIANLYNQISNLYN